MRYSAVVVLVAVLVACGDGRADRHDRPPRVAACITATEGLLAAVRDGRTYDRPACADLYRRSKCADAWQRFASGGTIEVPIAACADAYCRDLRTPWPRACSPDSFFHVDADRSIAFLTELDRHILVFEGLVDADAALLSRRSSVFQPVGAQDRVGDPRQGPTAMVTLVVSTDTLRYETIDVTQAELAVRVAAMAARSPRVLVSVTVDGPVSHARLVELMDVLKRAGATDFGFYEN